MYNYGLSGVSRPSPAAWRILNWLASDFVAVPDSIAVEGMKVLASGGEGDIPIVCGESSAAGIGAMLVSSANSTLTVLDVWTIPYLP